MEKDDIKIVQASSDQDYETARYLFREYEAYLNIDLCFQDFEKECRELSWQYGPPSGRLLLCYLNSSIAGCVALRKLEDNICEMKRLYVKTEYRRKGLGRLLSITIIEKAKDIGYSRMRLDTLAAFKESVLLYKSLGFKEIEPYRHNPLQDVIYLELSLTS